MGWVAVLLIGAGSNLDNLGLGIALGTRGTRIGILANVIIAAITMAATMAAVTSGHLLTKLSPLGVAGWLGPVIIISIDIGTLLLSIRARRGSDSVRALAGAGRYPRDMDGEISWREAVVLGVAMSVNNLGTGVGAGVVRMPAVAITASAGLCSLAFVGGGSHFGRVLGRLALGRDAPLIAGIMLLAVGAAMLPAVR